MSHTEKELCEGRSDVFTARFLRGCECLLMEFLDEIPEDFERLRRVIQDQVHDLLQSRAPCRPNTPRLLRKVNEFDEDLIEASCVYFASRFLLYARLR